MRLFLLVLALVPLAAAGAPYTHSSAVGAGVFAATSEKVYSFEATPGEAIVATLSWAGDARLFLSASIPSERCAFTDPTCIAGSVAGHEVCSTTSDGPGLYESPQTLVLTAPSAGVYTLAVATFAPTGSAPYDLTVAIGDGGAGRVSGPSAFFPSSVDLNPVHCAAVRTAS